MQKMLLILMASLLGTTLVRADLWTDIKDAWAKAQEQVQAEKQRSAESRPTAEKGWLEQMRERLGARTEAPRTTEVQRRFEECLRVAGADTQRVEECLRQAKAVTQTATQTTGGGWLDRLKQKADEAYARYKQEELQRELAKGAPSSSTPWYERMFGRAQS